MGRLPVAPGEAEMRCRQQATSARLRAMSTVLWGRDVAEAYDESSADMFAPEVLTPTVDRLAELADGGPALEFAIGTGRVAVPLHERGVSVHGIELSPYMTEQLRTKTSDIPVVIGAM